MKKKVQKCIYLNGFRTNMFYLKEFIAQFIMSENIERKKMIKLFSISLFFG